MLEEIRTRLLSFALPAVAVVGRGGARPVPWAAETRAMSESSGVMVVDETLERNEMESEVEVERMEGIGGRSGWERVCRGMVSLVGRLIRWGG